MRLWDIHPGYLNRQSLLGEHRELHGIVSILVNGKKGYARHPETLRWAGYGWAPRQRHRLLAAEMALRGFRDESPVRTRARSGEWPPGYIDEPHRQWQILAAKYRDRDAGRIPLPNHAQQLWRQHKYSVMARDAALYRKFGKQVSSMTPKNDFSALAARLVQVLRLPPTAGGLRNALQHMWGHVADSGGAVEGHVNAWTDARLLRELQGRALARREAYLLASTALSELGAWLKT